MKIIDKNTDYYDYYQNIYLDDYFTFDRRDSYNLSREEFASYFKSELKNNWAQDIGQRLILLQISNNFGLFMMEVKEYNEPGKDRIAIGKNYNLDLGGAGINNNVDRKLLELSEISCDSFKMYKYKRFNFEPQEKNNYDNKNKIIEEIKNNNYKYKRIFNEFKINKNGQKEIIIKHIPILKNIGIPNLIEPKEIYLAIEDYLSKEKTAAERIESLNLTDKDKLLNHGFDLKTSFRNPIK